MAEIYRKAALDKLSSPEQLDKMIKIISPSFWIAAIGGGGIIIVALIWSVFGRLPVNVSANGILMGESGIHTVAAETGGIVDQILVKNGDIVKKGQEIARIDTSKARDEIKTLEDRKEAVEKVTFESEGDVATADNKPLLDVKAQKMAGEVSLTTNNQGAALKMQFDSAKAAVLDQLDREIENYNKQIQAGAIKSTHDGYVSGLSIGEGNMVQQGTTVCRIASAGDDQIVVCYVPVTEGKKIKPGMQVVIYPTTVSRQEYGHMEGTVTAVAEYVTSREEIQSQLGDATLTQVFTQDGPVVSVNVEIKKDEGTVSGYWWSSKKGAAVDVAEGTLVSTDTVVEEKAPITMLIPLLKEQLSVKRKGQ